MCFTGALGSAALTDPAALSAISCVEHSLTTYLLMYQVKPSSNQVNLASCCVMPPDLTAFAKEFDIQLLTHNDPKGEIPFISFRCQLEFIDAKGFATGVQASQIKCSQCLFKHLRIC